MRHERRYLASAAGAVVVAAAVAGGLLWSGGDGIDDDGPHKLVVPKTVLRRYHGYAASRSGSLIQDHHAQLGVSDARGVHAVYWTYDHLSDGAMRQDGSLTFVGSYGTVADPEKALDVYFNDVLRKHDAEDETITLVGTPETVHPHGFANGVMKCQVERSSSLTGKKTDDYPQCVWADYSTVVLVSIDEPHHRLSLGELAQRAADLRNAVRVPLDLTG